MSNADAPLARLCSRQICRRPARATLTYVYADSTAVIGPLSVHAEPHAYDLCSPHASRLTPPRGWEIMRLETATPPGDGHRSTSAPEPASAPLAQVRNLGPGTGPGAPGSARRAGLTDLSAGPHAADSVPTHDVTDGAEAQADPRRGADPIAYADGEVHRVPEHRSDEPGRTGAADERTRRGRRLSAVPSTASGAIAAEPTGGEPSHREGAVEPEREDPEGGATALESPAATEPESDDEPSTLTDEIFAGESSHVVDSRRRLAAQPVGMRRPHLRRGRRSRTGT